MDGSLHAATSSELVGEALTTRSVSENGSRVRLGFADRDGEPCRIDLPVEAMSAAGQEHLCAPLALRVLN